MTLQVAWQVKCRHQRTISSLRMRGESPRAGIDCSHSFTTPFDCTTRVLLHIRRAVVVRSTKTLSRPKLSTAPPFAQVHSHLTMMRLYLLWLVGASLVASQSDMPSDGPSDVPSDLPSDVPSPVPTGIRGAPSVLPTLTSSTPAFQTSPSSLDPIQYNCRRTSQSLLECANADATGACNACLADSFALVSTCDAVEELCNVMDGCTACPQCQDDTKAFVDCMFRSSFGCGLNCPI